VEIAHLPLKHNIKYEVALIFPALNNLEESYTQLESTLSTQKTVFNGCCKVRSGFDIPAKGSYLAWNPSTQGRTDPVELFPVHLEVARTLCASAECMRRQGKYFTAKFAMRIAALAITIQGDRIKLVQQ
jgi:hypothetical protein